MFSSCTITLSFTNNQYFGGNYRKWNSVQFFAEYANSAAQQPEVQTRFIWSFIVLDTFSLRDRSGLQTDSLVPGCV